VKVKVKNSSASGKVEAPPSKSYTHRAILAGLYSDNIVIEDPLMSEDPQASLRCAKALGADATVKEDLIKIEGVSGSPETPDRVLNCGNSGTTLRLFTGAASLAEESAVLTGDESLRDRPNDPLIDAISDLDAETFSTRGNGKAPLVVKGVIEGSDVSIDGSISSQFISSLLMALPLTSGGNLEIEGELKSKPYVDMTVEVMEKMDVEVRELENGYEIPGGQAYSAERFQVPGDFSSASYPLAAGALTGNVTVENLYPGAQGDAVIVDILRIMGAEVDWDKQEGVVEVRNRGLDSIELDASDNPDLVPTLAVLATQAEGKTEITGINHLRHKETDRIEALETELGKMDAEIETGEDFMIIDGEASKLKGAEVNGRDDHRIVMALTLAGMMAEGEIVIDTAECVEISYPGFFEHMKELGVDLERL
jgi:3-phosphoshikimate 1-carboxyvinyltransferase